MGTDYYLEDDWCLKKHTDEQFHKLYLNNYTRHPHHSIVTSVTNPHTLEQVMRDPAAPKSDSWRETTSWSLCSRRKEYFVTYTEPTSIGETHSIHNQVRSRATQHDHGHKDEMKQDSETHVAMHLPGRRELCRKVGPEFGRDGHGVGAFRAQGLLGSSVEFEERVVAKDGGQVINHESVLIRRAEVMIHSRVRINGFRFVTHAALLSCNYT